MDDPEADKIAMITKREREIISLLGEGLQNKQIASRLSISDKLGVANRLELIVYAYRQGLASPAASQV
jgi:DNA-binding NarL/FixJ family response regulator